MIIDPFDNYNPYKSIWYRKIIRRIDRKRSIRKIFNM